MKLLQFLSIIYYLASLAQAHMEMIFPPPFKSKSNPYTEGDIDYNMRSPLDAAGTDFPCKGYLDLLGTSKGKATASFQAGNNYEMTINGTVPHGGGSCQASLSFDKGSTWKVIHSYIGNCPIFGISSYNFTIPSNTPTGKAVFAWSWFNNIGNREIYMNCAAVDITGGSRRRTSGLGNRPSMFVANIGNGCVTKAGFDVVFPNPGQDVSRDSSNTSPPDGTCASALDNKGTGLTTAAVPYNQSTKPSATPTPTSNSSSRGAIFIAVSHSENSVPTPTNRAPGSSQGFKAGGACKKEGEWNCINNVLFQRCAAGLWSVPMQMAQGTQCSNGTTMAFAINTTAKKSRRYINNH